jgi:hypothetical protein
MKLGARISLIIFILLGVAKMPYGYYQFLRIYVCLLSLFLVIKAFQKGNKNGFEYLYLGLAILFNPILPIYLSKGIWVVFDIAAVILLGVSLALDKAD